MYIELDVAMKCYLENVEYLKRLVDLDGLEISDGINLALDRLAEEIQLIIDKENA